MSGIPTNNLPLDQHVEDFSASPVRNISEYIQRVMKYTEVKSSPGCFYVYRGEPEIYPTPCRPSLFRGNFLNGNPFFEKGLCNAMRQSALSGEHRYLDNAIDAQHGEFPSRLLDVSYNCLTALYFSVTPFYHKEETALDDKDGMVYLFLIDEIFSPSAQNTNDNYEAIISRNQSWYQNKILFGKNHKFIDHSPLNKRIVAQQGAFILFQGDESEPLPPWMTYGIRIPYEHKAEIRRELKLLFGIHTGSIYPEATNLVKELTRKSQLLNTDDFTLKTELDYAMQMLAKELEYYLGYAQDNKNNTGQIDQILIHIERIINSYRKGLLELWSENPEADSPVRQAIERYNKLVKRFSDGIKSNHIGEFSGMFIKIQ